MRKYFSNNFFGWFLFFASPFYISWAALHYYFLPRVVVGPKAQDFQDFSNAFMTLWFIFLYVCTGVPTAYKWRNDKMSGEKLPKK